jgi:hypothetical protein
MLSGCERNTTQPVLAKTAAKPRPGTTNGKAYSCQNGDGR